MPALWAEPVKGSCLPVALLDGTGTKLRSRRDLGKDPRKNGRGKKSKTKRKNLILAGRMEGTDKEESLEASRQAEKVFHFK